MKIITFILCLCIGVFFLTQKKPEPTIITVNSASTSQNCISPNENKTKHNGSYMKRRGFYIMELAKKDTLK